MNVCHWNVSRKDGSMFGTAKYEAMLANKLSSEVGVSVQRIQRPESGIQSTMPFSWIFRYGSSDEDLIHATFQTIAPAAYFHRANNLVVTVHDLTPLVYPSEIRDFSLRFQWTLTPRSLEMADNIIAISEFTKQEIVRLTDVPASKINVVHQGIDHELYRPRPMEQSKRELGLDADTTYLLVVSSELEHKRIEKATSILERVRESSKDVKLIKAGYGEEMTGEHIINIGWVDEEKMPALYSAADVYLHPSEYEGFGLPVLEAMACGTPVVARDVASIPEIVGGCFDLVSPDATADEFAEAIWQYLEVEYPVHEAVERSKEFSWAKTAVDTLNVYREVLHRQNEPDSK